MEVIEWVCTSVSIAIFGHPGTVQTVGMYPQNDDICCKSAYYSWKRFKLYCGHFRQEDDQRINLQLFSSLPSSFVTTTNFNSRCKILILPIARMRRFDCILHFVAEKVGEVVRNFRQRHLFDSWNNSPNKESEGDVLESSDVRTLWNVNQNLAAN